MGFEAGFSAYKKKSDYTLQELLKKEGRDNEIILCSWCSDGKWIDEDICSLLKKVNDLVYEIEYDNLDNLIKYAESKMNSIEIEPVKVTHGIKFLDKDLNGRLELIRLDGLQVQFDDGTIRQVVDEDSMFFISRSKTDIEQIEFFISFFNYVTELKEHNFDEYYVTYWRSF